MIDHCDTVGWPAAPARIVRLPRVLVTREEQLAARAELEQLGAATQGLLRTRELWQRAMNNRRWATYRGVR